ncbi:hypothetical protein QR680_017536 [Steinernema hermaphroditum]|uniref:Uncharacterized protein n=1 Tax=Steinernema hermaphroditum TaxID=289476 RepID=A0AA39HFJ2_9BILA|nr:hypothetical protein QR680_017536 [Steinernema hermaphroditum]
MERRMVGVRLIDRKSNEWLRGVTKRPLGRPRTRWSDEFTKKLCSKRWRHRTQEEAKQRWLDLGRDNM